MNHPTPGRPISQASGPRAGSSCPTTKTTRPTRAGIWIAPALTRLLGDIAKGLIDVVVAYKIDRLTRSLTDFAKMIEVLERHGVLLRIADTAVDTRTSLCASLTAASRSESAVPPIRQHNDLEGAADAQHPPSDG